MPPLDRPLIIPWIRLDKDGAAEAALALRRAKEPWLAGFCLFGGEAQQVRDLTSRLRDAAGKPILIASDMERGAGQQVKGLTDLPDAGIWGLGASPEEVRAFGYVTACEARSVGVDVLFAPVLDVRSEPMNPIVGNRAFGWDPRRVGTLGAAFVEGALVGGAMPTGKHWPGHGATTKDSHDALPVVEVDGELLLLRDIQPFIDAIAEGCGIVMTAHVAYPALDETGVIASFSAPIIDLLRELVDEEQLDDPYVVSDALLMAGASQEGGETVAGRRALAAGCDGLLIPSDPERLAAELLEGASPELQTRADEAVDRLEHLRKSIHALSVPPPRTIEQYAGVPGRVADRALRLAGAPAAMGLGEGDDVIVIDDDAMPERGRILVARGKAAGARVFVAHLEKDGPLPSVPGDMKPAAIVVLASVRAWKGAHGISPAARELVHKLLARATEDASVWDLSPGSDLGGVHVPGTGPHVEQALADRLFAEIRESR